MVEHVSSETGEGLVNPGGTGPSLIDPWFVRPCGESEAGGAGRLGPQDCLPGTAWGAEKEELLPDNISLACLPKPSKVSCITLYIFEPKESNRA